MVKIFGKAALNREVADENGVKLYKCSQCKYTTVHIKHLNQHKTTCKKYLYSKLSPREKEAEFPGAPSFEPEKTKFGRKAHNLHECKCCDIVFVDARYRAEHRRSKKHKDR